MSSLATVPGATRWKKAMRKMKDGTPHITHGRMQSLTLSSGRRRRNRQASPLPYPDVPLSRSKDMISLDNVPASDSLSGEVLHNSLSRFEEAVMSRRQLVLFVLVGLAPLL